MNNDTDNHNVEDHESISRQGVPLKASGRSQQYMGTLEDTITVVMPPVANMAGLMDVTGDKDLDLSHRELTPG